jgi:CHASE3 domain sensor protein
MKWNVGTKIGAGYSIVLVIFIVVALASWRNVERQTQDAAWVTHTREVLTTLARMMTALQEAETDERGFIITGEEAYLSGYNAAIAALEGHRLRLAELVSDNPRQSARIQAVSPLIAERLDTLGRGIEARRKTDFASAQQIVISGHGKRTMDKIVAVINSMVESEEQLLASRASLANAATRDAVTTIFLGTGLAIVLSAVVGFLITRNVAGPLHTLTTAADRITVGDLGTNVSLGDREDELGALSRSFERMIQSLRSMATAAEQIAAGDLRQYVIRRPARLARAPVAE